MLGLILTIIVVGAIAGFVARLLVPGRQDLSVVATIALGIVGSLVGGLLGYAAVPQGRGRRLPPAVRHHRLDHRRRHRPGDLAVVAAPQRRARLTDTPSAGAADEAAPAALPHHAPCR